MAICHILQRTFSENLGEVHKNEEKIGTVDLPFEYHTFDGKIRFYITYVGRYDDEDGGGLILYQGGDLEIIFFTEEELLTYFNQRVAAFVNGTTKGGAVK